MTVRIAEGLAIGTMLAAAWTLWPGPQSVAGTDSVAYLTSGVNLFQSGRFINAFGETETWFPPMYPLLVGVASWGGQLDPVASARIVSLVFALIGVWLVVSITRRQTGTASAAAGAAAALFLALNPSFQAASTASLSEATGATLALCAFAAWLRLESPSAPRGLALGALIGAATLTRPEFLLLLPCWFLVDGYLDRSSVRSPAFALAALAAFLVVAPYVVWLSIEAGSLTLTGKMAVNLASGRATYFGVPRERIDPVSNELTFGPFDVTRQSEVRRYVSNWRQIARRYRTMFRLPRDLGVIALAIAGAIVLLRKDRYRLLLGLAAFFAYLPVMAALEVKERYLLSTLPPLAILFGVGTWAAWEALVAGKTTRTVRLMMVGLLVWAGLGMIAGGIEQPRAVAAAKTAPPESLLKDAGSAVRRFDGSSPVYESWSLVGFYSHRPTRLLTPDPLPVLLAYMRKHEGAQGRPLIVISSLDLDHYDPSVLALATSPPPGFARVLELSDARGWVVILQVDLTRVSLL